MTIIDLVIQVLDEYVFAVGKKNADGNRQTSVVETCLEYGRQRIARGSKTQKAIEERTVLSAVPLHFDH